MQKKQEKEIENVMKNLIESFNLYIKYIRFEKNLTPNTISSYSADILHFVNYLKDIGTVKTSDLNLSMFREYLKYLDNYKYSNATMIRKFSSYINFFKFLEDNDLVDKKLTQFIERPRKHHRLYSFLSQRETKILLESIKPVDDFSLRDRSIIELIYSTGARISEVGNIRIKDINLSENEILVHGKGRKERMVYLNHIALDWLNQYLKIRDNFILHLNKRYADDSYLFLNKDGKKLSTRSIRSSFKKYVARAGIGRNPTVHSLRHSFATHLLEEGAGIKEIQELLGHETVATTQIYLHLNINKLKKDYGRFHPRAN